MAGPGRISRRLGNDERTTAERLTLAVSLLLLAALVGGLVWFEVAGGDEPAHIDVTFEHDAITRHGDEWYLPITVRNAGDLATGTVRIEFERAVGGGEPPELAEIDLMYIAGGEEATSTLVFDERPAPGDLEVGTVSITEP